MDNKITIIEGPMPTFEAINSEWAAAIVEAPASFEVVDHPDGERSGTDRPLQPHLESTDTMYLRYRNPIGLEQEIPIAARAGN